MIDTPTTYKTEWILEKGSGKINEDCLLIRDNLYGVFDGASSIDNALFDQNKTGGLLAAATARDVFAGNHFPLETLGIKANTEIRKKMTYHSVDMEKRHRIWSTSAAVVRIAENRIEWFQAGDAQIILINEDGSFQVPTSRPDHDFETLTLLKEQGFKKNDAFKETIKRIRSRMNIDYGVLNGEPAAADFCRTGSEPAAHVKTVLLFTDGLNLPAKTPEREKQFDGLVRIFLAEGLNGLKDHIRHMEACDPDIQCYPRFKCHDDIAAIAIHL